MNIPTTEQVKAAVEAIRAWNPEKAASDLVELRARLDRLQAETVKALAVLDRIAGRIVQSTN